jgi:hypothetical protein
VPLSSDPDARKRQLANLVSTDAGGNALKHGTRSEPVVQDLSSEFLPELQREFPGESDYWRRVQARRMAKIQLLGEYLGRRPSLVLNLRTGKLNPAAAEEESLSRALLADLERAQQRRREAHGKPAHGLEQLRQRGAQIIDQREAAGGE